MPRLLALEWNETEARVAVASLRGTQAVFEQAFAVPLETGSGDDDKSIPAIGSQIAAGLPGGLKGMDALVAISRTNIELRQISVPAAPDEELPDMVRFQAMREFNALDDTWPLDFIPLSSDPEQPREVLAATINPDQLSQLRRVCREAGVKPQRMVLRPCAAASLFSRHTAVGDGQVRLLVDLLQSEVDLTLLIDGTVNLTRCARMHSDPLDRPESPKTLISELRRTIAAAHNQLGDRRIDELVLFGSGPRHETLIEAVRTELSLPVTLFDPFESLELGGHLAQKMPDSPDRFAPLFGILLDELEQRGHAVDFLHPRRRPPPPSRHKSYAMAGLAVALVLLSFVGWRWNTRRVLLNERDALNNEIASSYEVSSSEDFKKHGVSAQTMIDQASKLGGTHTAGKKQPADSPSDAPSAEENREKAKGKPGKPKRVKIKLEKLEEHARQVDRAVTAVESWNADKVDWLKELHELSKTLSKTLPEAKSLGSEEIPATKLSEEILVTQFNARRVQGTGGGEIKLKGWAKSSNAIKNMERELRDAKYHVKAGDKSSDPSRDKYRELFDYTLSVTGGDDRGNE